MKKDKPNPKRENLLVLHDYQFTTPKISIASRIMVVLLL